MNIPQRKILLAHSNRKERGKLAIMLSQFEHCVSFPDEAKRPNFKDDEFDLIIVDEFFSQGPGFVFLQHLSKDNRSKTIFLSSASEVERNRCREAMGIYECIEKPLTPISLAVIVCDFFISSNSIKESLVPMGV